MNIPILSVYDEDGNKIPIPAIKGATGPQGIQGVPGTDGFSPSASVERVEGGAVITITDKDGTTVAEVYDGQGGGGGTSDFNNLLNRPKYNGDAMTGSTDIPEVKTATWDAKQDAISDLDAIRSGAALGATALQAVPATYRTSAVQDVIDGKQNTIIAGQKRQITALKNLLDGVAYSTEEDTTVAYSKTVPTGAQAVSVNSFGGHSEVVDGEIISAEVTEIVSKKEDSTVIGTLNISTALLTFLADKGYGWSAGTVYNEVDFERKKYIQRVGSVDLGSLSWVARPTSAADKYRMYTEDLSSTLKPITSAQIANMTCIKYVPTTANYIYGANTGISSNGDSIVVYDEDYNTSSSADSFKSAMNGIMLYYELAEPVEYDISGYLPDDENFNFLLTEPGGALTFKQSDTQLNVPQDLTWAVQQSGGGGTWGSITGDIADQTDLKDALDTKADKPTIKTTMDSVAVVNSQYYLGTQSAVSITMPIDAELGKKIKVFFKSGATACTLTCNLTGFDYVPKANMSCLLTFRLVHKADAEVTGDEDEWTVQIEEG